MTLVPLFAGTALMALFVRSQRRAEEPILPLHLLAHRTRNAANLARGLVYAGMYGTFFFLSQFLQDVQGYSPLRTGASFLPLPATVFLSSQLASRVLVRRFRPKTLMLLGISSSITGLVLSTQLHASSPYLQVVANLVLIGAGTGISLVSLTSASLEGVAPEDAGAASGLVNVVQQLGAAVGVAVLVTVFGDAAGHVELGSNAVTAGRALLHVVHGLDTTFAAGALFAVIAFAAVALFVRPPRPVLVVEGNSDDLEELELELELAALEGAA
jgi:predicted MFS family arabinose efflux permease